MNSLARLIGERIKLARQEDGLSQDSLSAQLGFNDRQTLSSIELGQRAVAPAELVKLTQKLGRPLSYFTDPYVVAGKNAFSYRAKQARPAELADFERQATKLIAAQRRFREWLGRVPSPVQPQLTSMSPRVALDFATFQGERSAAAWQLGEVPARRLREVVEHELGIAVFYVDAPPSISGAACRLNDGGYILINRNEPWARQNFDLGHEVFHLLTWEKMPPDRIDLIASETKSTGKRPAVEKLADAYTAGLLMPETVIKSRWAHRGSSTSMGEWIPAQAAELRVSPIALYWRLVNLALIQKDAALLKVVSASRVTVSEGRPQLYSADFVQDLHAVLERGHVTVLRAVELLDSSVTELEDLFASYKLPVPFAL